MKKLEDSELEQVHNYKYLGSWIYKDGRSLEEIKYRTGQAKMSFLESKELAFGATGECSRSTGEDLCQRIRLKKDLVEEDRYFRTKIAERKFEFAGHSLRGSRGSDDEDFGRDD